MRSHLHVMLVLLDRDWGVEADPQKKFLVTNVGVIFNQWGVKPPTPRQIERCSLIFIYFLLLILTLIKRNSSTRTDRMCEWIKRPRNGTNNNRSKNLVVFGPLCTS